MKLTFYLVFAVILSCNTVLGQSNYDPFETISDGRAPFFHLNSQYVSQRNVMTNRTIILAWMDRIGGIQPPGERLPLVGTAYIYDYAERKAGMIIIGQISNVLMESDDEISRAESLHELADFYKGALVLTGPPTMEQVDTNNIKSFLFYDKDDNIYHFVVSNNSFSKIFRGSVWIEEAESASTREELAKSFLRSLSFK